MEAVKRLIRGMERLFNIAVGVSLVLILLYGGYVLWDAYMVYSRAGVPDEIMKYKPSPSNPTLSELQKINPDVCAWLTVDGTKINYPVLQGKNNMEYLNCDIYKNYSLSGSVFLDYRNNRNFTDSYSLIYGHHMDDGVMFGDLTKFGDETYFDAHRTGQLLVPGKTYNLEIYAYLHVDAYESPMFDVDLSEKDYAARLDYIRKSAVYYQDVGVKSSDRIVALSTCSSATTNGRSIVVAKLVEYA